MHSGSNVSIVGWVRVACQREDGRTGDLQTSSECAAGRRV